MAIPYEVVSILLIFGLMTFVVLTIATLENVKKEWKLPTLFAIISFSLLFLLGTLIEIRANLPQVTSKEITVNVIDNIPIVVYNKQIINLATLASRNFENGTKIRLRHNVKYHYFMCFTDDDYKVIDEKEQNE